MRQNVNKHLYSSTDKSITGKSRVINKHDIKYHDMGGKGQMLVLTAIIIAVLLIVLSIVITMLANIDVSLPAEKSTSLVSEFQNVRSAFGTALLYNMGDVSDTVTINYIFNATREMFSTVEIGYGYYFNAEIVQVTDDGVVAAITLASEDTYIYEEVPYTI